MEKLPVIRISLLRPVDAVGGADDAVVSREAEPGCPSPKAVHDKVALPTELITSIGFRHEHGHGFGASLANAVSRGNSEQLLTTGFGADVDASEDLLGSSHLPMVGNAVKPGHRRRGVGSIRSQDHLTSP